MTPEKLKIVIVDDEEDLCFLLSGILTTQGFDVRCYYTLGEGIKGIKEFHPHWIIIDNDLPDGYGWEQTNAILGVMPEANIIKMSANPDSEKLNGEIKVYYLSKPIHVTSIIDLIARSRSVS
jgi:two-component system OmpR family response regulator